MKLQTNQPPREPPAPASVPLVPGGRGLGRNSRELSARRAGQASGEPSRPAVGLSRAGKGAGPRPLGSAAREGGAAASNLSPCEGRTLSSSLQRSAGRLLLLTVRLRLGPGSHHAVLPRPVPSGLSSGRSGYTPSGPHQPPLSPTAQGPESLCLRPGPHSRSKAREAEWAHSGPAVTGPGEREAGQFPPSVVHVLSQKLREACFPPWSPGRGCFLSLGDPGAGRSRRESGLQCPGRVHVQDEWGPELPASQVHLQSLSGV